MLSASTLRFVSSSFSLDLASADPTGGLGSNGVCVHPVQGHFLSVLRMLAPLGHTGSCANTPAPEGTGGGGGEELWLDPSAASLYSSSTPHANIRCSQSCLTIRLGP